MPTQTPVFQLQSFPHYEPDTLFHMVRLEEAEGELAEIGQPHAHTYYQLMWIGEGGGTHTIGARSYAMAPAQLYFLAPGLVHRWDLSPDCQGYQLFFDADFCRDRSGHFLYRYPFFNADRHPPFLAVHDPDALFSTVLDFMYREYASQQPNRLEMILSALHIILELTDRQYRAQWDGVGSYLYDRIRQYEELIEHQFQTVREVSEYAAQMNLTPHYLNQLCKKIIGKTASQVFQERVLLEAKFLLHHTYGSVKEIGFQLGFQDPSYFVRFFKKWTGETPASFRHRPRSKR
ncbi:helix-turn-helix domain-containing protein [Larkinella ripae]